MIQCGGCHRKAEDPAPGVGDIWWCRRCLQGKCAKAVAEALT